MRCIFFRLLVLRLCYCVPLEAAVGGRINGRRGGGGVGFYTIIF